MTKRLFAFGGGGMRTEADSDSVLQDGYQSDISKEELKSGWAGTPHTAALPEKRAD